MVVELLGAMVDRSIRALYASRFHPGQTVRQIEGWFTTCDTNEIPIIGPDTLLVVDRNVLNGTVAVIPAIDSTDKLSTTQRIKKTSLAGDLANLKERETIHYLDASLVVAE